MAARPSGRPIQVKTNFFAIKQLPTRPFYQYNAILKHGIDGEVLPVPMKAGERYREILDKLFSEHPTPFTPRPSYDGAKNMYSSRQISEGEYTVRMFRNQNSKRGQYTIRITPINTIQPSDLARLITPGGAQNTQANTTAVNLLQIIISQAPNLQHHFAPHSKSFYVDMGRSITKDLPSGLQAWRGFFQSVRPVLGKVIINIDTTTAAVYKPESLLVSATTHLGCTSVRELVNKCADPRCWQELRRFYKGLTVVAYPKVRQKIEELVKSAGSFDFSKDGSSITVAEHFMQRHNMKLKYPDVFGVRIGKSAVYPAELVRIVPGQVYKKRLDPADSQVFMTVAVTNPRDRINSIAEAVTGKYLDYAGSSFMQEAGMSVDPNPLQVTGRELDAPMVVCGGKEVSVRPGAAAWNVANQRFQVPAKISAWAVVSFEDPGQSQNVTSFAQQLSQNLNKLGIEFGVPAPLIRQGSPHNVEDSLTEIKKKVESHPDKPRLGLVLVILPRDAAPLRKQVKQWGDMMAAVPTQCVRGGKWQTANDQYCNNVALKINARCGGINSIIRAPAVDFIKNAMIVGCDVSHPSPGIKNRPSIASAVASVDPDATRYHAYVRLQNPRQEIIEDLSEMIKGALNHYFQTRKHTWPKHLVVYRDGVSEGEYLQVGEKEVKAIEDVLDDLERHTKYRPTLIFIVVGKRHHIRFFPTDPGRGDRKGNCNPGLVVDTEIVHSTYPDFYLLSHAGILGTSRPSHYVVLKNTARLTDDQIQQISYALCHVYASATRAVSIPAPVYYADRLCTRADFQFRPNSGLSFDETTSNVSDEFDLNLWRQAFGQSKLSNAMYFL